MFNEWNNSSSACEKLFILKYWKCRWMLDFVKFCKNISVSG